MSKSPGHLKWPQHKVEEERVGHTVKVEIEGMPIAQSADVIRMKEDGHPIRYYFPRRDVAMDRLERSFTSTECPFKGTAHYFNVKVQGKTYKDAVWTYEDPYEEHHSIKDYVAFSDDKVPEIHISA